MVLLLPHFLFSAQPQQEIKATLNALNYSIKDGLPSNETYDVYQDSKGFIWIATDNGAVKFDGENFKTFTTIDGLTDNTIFRISEDHLGRIWFMTYNRKLCYLEDGKFVPYEFNEELGIALKDLSINEVITDFHLDNENKIHLCLVNFTMVTISKDGEVDVEITDKRSAYMKYHFSGADFNLFYNQVKPYVQKAPHHSKFNVQTKSNGIIHLITRESNIYLATSKGLMLLSDHSKKIKWSILEKYYITGIDFDFEGGLWCSTLKNGVLYIPNPNISFFETSTVINNFIEAIVPQDSLLTFSMAKNGKNNWVLNVKEKSLSPYLAVLEGEKLPNSDLSEGVKFERPVMFNNLSSPVLSIVRLKNGYLNYFTNNSSLQVSHLLKNEKPKFNLSESFLYKDIAGNEWFWLKGKLLGLKKSNLQIINVSKPYNYPFKIIKPLRVSTGKLLLATTNGLYTFNEDSLTVEPHLSFHEFTNFRIQDITETNDGSLIFATKANGIFIFQDNVTIQYSEKEGLISNTINKIAYDSFRNIIWIATNNGMSKLIQKSPLEWKAESVITQYDGLSSQNIRSFYFYNNYLAFTNNKGLNLVSENYLKPFAIQPILYSKGYRVNNKLYKSEKLLSLPYDSNNISLSFQAISYKTNKSLIYEYQLLPNDSLWQKSKSSQINFNSMAPGEYTLNVRVSNFYEVFSETQTVHFTILPAFWMTSWFYTLLIILGLVFVYFVSSSSIKIYKNQANFERTLKEMQMVSLQSKMNPHFIFNSLNSIQNYILKNEKTEANDYLLEFSALIRSILQNSELTDITLKKELETLKMYVNLEKKRIRKNFTYTEIIDSEINPNLCIIPTLLIQPYIENAIWHGKVHTNPIGEILVRIKRANDVLYFEITDNGIGIENAEKSKVKTNGHKSIGSVATKKRIQLLSELNNGITEVKLTELHPENSEFKGTKITFSLPYQKLDKAQYG